MKVCKKCGEITKDDSPICQTPNCYGNNFENYEKIKNIDINKLAHKTKISKIINFSIILLYIIIIGLLIALNAFKGTLTLILILKTIVLIIITIVCIKSTSTVFLITHIFSLKDINENNMSDFYNTYIKIIGLFIGTFSIILLIKPIFYL